MPKQPRVHPALATFGANVRRARTSKRITQEGLAVRAKVSVSYVSMLERGQRCPPLTTVHALAKALGTSAANLVTAPPPAAEQAAAAA